MANSDSDVAVAVSRSLGRAMMTFSLALLVAGAALGFLGMNGGSDEDGIQCGAPLFVNNEELSDLGEIACELEYGRSNRRAYALALLGAGAVVLGGSMFVLPSPDRDEAE